jgi:hypothetical protein
MSAEAASLSRTVSAMRPMVPDKDFDISKRFYVELVLPAPPIDQPAGRDATGRILLHPAGLLRA